MIYAFSVWMYSTSYIGMIFNIQSSTRLLKIMSAILQIAQQHWDVCRYSDEQIRYL